MYGWLAALLLVLGGAVWLKTTLKDNAALSNTVAQQQETVRNQQEQLRFKDERLKLVEASHAELQKRKAATDAAKAKSDEAYARLMRDKKNAEWGDTPVPADVVQWMRNNATDRHSRLSPRDTVAGSSQQGLPAAGQPTDPGTEKR